MKTNIMKKFIVSVVTMTTVLVGSSTISTPVAYAGMDPYIGEIEMFAGNYAPQGWALCNGQTLSIAQNQTLFAVIGTTYGGDGKTTFCLPDLRGRVPIGMGQAPGLPYYAEGQTGGSGTVTLTPNQDPLHNHPLNASTGVGNTNVPSPNAVLGIATTPDRQEVNIYTTSPANTTLGPTSIGPSGGSQPVDSMQPYLTINYIIALQGIWPTRS